MHSTPSHFLFIILALLQFVAPLVHAHTGEELSVQGVHLPGYEHYNANHDLPEFHDITHSWSEEHSIISVGTGIKHKKTSSGYTSPYFLATEKFSLRLITSQRQSIPRQSRQYYKLATHYVLLPSRAPPTQ